MSLSSSCLGVHQRNSSVHCGSDEKITALYVPLCSPCANTQHSTIGRRGQSVLQMAFSPCWWWWQWLLKGLAAGGRDCLPSGLWWFLWENITATTQLQGSRQWLHLCRSNNFWTDSLSLITMTNIYAFIWILCGKLTQSNTCKVRGEWYIGFIIFFNKTI